MAEFCLPSPTHNSRAVNDTELEQLHHPWSGDGLVGSPADADLVYADNSGMVAKLRANRFALVRGRMYGTGTSDISKTITANASGLTRVDLIVLRLTRATAAVTSVVKAGTPGAGAPAVTLDLGTTGVWELPLATVTVPSGDSSIAADQVTPVAWYLGETPISCKSTTRPPHSPSQMIVETDTGSVLVSINGSWVVLREDTGWVNVTPAPGWTTSPTGFLRVRRKNGWGFTAFDLFRNGSQIAAGTNTLIGTLPAAYWPTQPFFAPFDTYRDPGGGRLNIGTNGQMFISSYDSAIASDGVVNGSAAWPL